jgi:hypothetical protein
MSNEIYAYGDFLLFLSLLLATENLQNHFFIEF